MPGLTHSIDQGGCIRTTTEQPSYETGHGQSHVLDPAIFCKYITQWHLAGPSTLTIPPQAKITYFGVLDPEGNFEAFRSRPFMCNGFYPSEKKWSNFMNHLNRSPFKSNSNWFYLSLRPINSGT